MKQQTNFKETEIGQIPEDWEIICLGSGIEIIGGGTPKTSNPEYWNGDISWISVTDFGNGRWINQTEKHITEKGLNESSTKILHKGQIIISARGTVGEIRQIKKDMAFNQSCYGIDGKKKISNDFLYSLLKNKSKNLQSQGHGAVFNTITKDTFNRIYVALPDSIEQSSIAKILSDLDSKIELNQQMNKTLEAIGQAIFKRWFIDFEFPNEKGKPYKSSSGDMIDSELGEIPKGWKVSKIGKEFETILGGTPSTTNKSYWENGTVAWINSGAINDFPIINASQYITEAGLNNSATQIMPKKTVVLPFVISINKDIKISITGIEISGNQSVLGVVENQKIPCEFIYYWVAKIKDDIYSWATGGAQQHINKNNVDNTLILIPSDGVINNFKKLLIPIFDKILNNSYQNKNLSQIRDSLLPKLMSGKIRVPIEAKT